MTQSVASPLKNPSYRNLFFAQVTSLLGTGLTTIALALLAFDMAGEDAGQVLGTALAIKMVAYVFVAPIAGGFAHLLPRKASLFILDVIRAGLILTLPFLSTPVELYAVIFLLNVCSACFTPLFQSTIPDILPNEERYTKALSYSRLAYDLENMLSPTLAALLLTLWSFDSLFMLNGVTFILSALLVLITTLPKAEMAERESSIWKNVSFGIKAYLKTPRLRGLLALHGAVACGGAMVIVNTVVYVRSHLGLGESETAFVMMASGAGSMIIALILPRLLKTLPDRPMMILGGSLIASALLWGMLLPSLTGVLIIWFLLGAGWSLIQTPAARVVNRSASSGDRAAYFSANFALSHGGWFMGYVLAGWLGATLGLSQTFSILACCASLLTLWALKLWPTNDPVVVEHTHAAQHHDHPHHHNDHHHEHDHEGWEGPEPHVHEHRHKEVRHAHPFVIDAHHVKWPQR
ncbi:Major facilitator transporter [Candidatus Terasakiella magnetica]|uniref:Major facilitator transporter n=1 Tax=Candidatus Terasakiella magnetica TaxID=1867952 RepID=A0A1C3RHM8_9PROT|nr:MFS transporter [Candidatus Terasakiella magnetica]SCA56780.1 Major facilitator transporter [Candidatus Terasakiella magnetica]